MVPAGARRFGQLEGMSRYVCARLSCVDLRAHSPLFTPGAIMFNDTLTLEQCKMLVSKLSDTALPFQCAHGR